MHDYEPEWDYDTIELHEVACLNDTEKSRVLEIIQTTKTTLANALGFDDFEVFFVDHMGLAGNGHREDAVAIYCRGTSSRPVIGFDVEMIQETCQNVGNDWLVEFEVSLARELAHAFQETMGLDQDHPHGFNEEDAEQFGRRWVQDREVDVSALNRAFANASRVRT